MWTMIIPCAARLDWRKTRPKWLLTAPDGRLLIEHAAASVLKTALSRVIIAFLRESEDLFRCTEVMRRAFGDYVECVILESPTQGPADTVRQVISKSNVGGPVCIKDSDGFFSPVQMPTGSFVAVTDITKLARLSLPAKKSFVVLNDQGLVTDILEKTIASNIMSSGLYGFQDAASFVRSFDVLADTLDSRALFVSHVLEHAIECGEVFVPFLVENLVSIETLADWSDLKSRQPTLILDIDGVIFRNQSKYFSPYWGDAVEPITENVSHILKLQQRGAQLVFITSRPPAYRDQTQAALEALGFKVQALVMGANHGTRYIVNDYASSNSYPSAVSINIERNRPILRDLLLPEFGSEDEAL